jgi:hypothetical protein
MRGSVQPDHNMSCCILSYCRWVPALALSQLNRAARPPETRRRSAAVSSIAAPGHGLASCSVKRNNLTKREISASGEAAIEPHDSFRELARPLSRTLRLGKANKSASAARARSSGTLSISFRVKVSLIGSVAERDEMPSDCRCRCKRRLELSRNVAVARPMRHRR